MKLSVSTLGCPDWSLAQIAGACAEHGIGGIDLRGLGGEIDITRLREFTAELDGSLAILQSRQISLPCFNTSVTLVSPSARRWQDLLDEAFRYTQLAQKTGTPFLRVFGGGLLNDMTLEDARFMAQRHLRQIVKICKAHNVMPLVETHDLWATSGAIRELLHEMDPADVGILWDIEHTFRAGECPSETAAALGRRIKHVHFKDSVQRGGKNIPRLLGEGDLPLNDAAKAIREMNFEGFVCLESEKRWHPDDAPDPLEAFARFKAFAAANF